MVDPPPRSSALFWPFHRPVRYLVVPLGAGLLLAMGGSFASKKREFLLPGQTSDGHHLAQAACERCHGDGFAGVRNEGCLGCHADKARENSHPEKTFDDPRWASTLDQFDVTLCVTCHREHRRSPGGVTVGPAFCFPCHDDIPGRRQSHAGFGPASCGTGGCHNYHDNRGLNTAYLRAHLGEPATFPSGALPAWGSRPPSAPSLASPPAAASPPAPAALDAASASAAASGSPPVPASAGAAASAPALASAPPAAAAPPAPPLPTPPPTPDIPAGVVPPAGMVEAWQASAHGAHAVGCAKCHGQAGAYDRSPPRSTCADCHGFEVRTFDTGKHGVRPAIGLPPLTPALARLPMRHDVAHRAMSCSTCHDPHSVDTRKAAVDACLSCHDDEHSRAFRASKHGATAGRSEHGRPAPTAVTCATCHLPRLTIDEDGKRRVAVSHNNSAGLRPRDRMARAVCTSCHGLAFSLDALFDERLIRSNFSGQPSRKLETNALMEASKLNKGK